MMLYLPCKDLVPIGTTLRLMLTPEKVLKGVKNKTRTPTFQHQQTVTEQRKQLIPFFQIC